MKQHHISSESMLRSCTKLPLLVLGCLLLSTCQQSPQMNVLVLVLDDLGYGDLAINNQASLTNEPLYTPVLDAFNTQSLTFARHYTESTCSPSRAALLSGRYPTRFGFTSNGRGLPPEITTLPEAFQQGGYNTRFLGKWHTGHTTELALPHNQGFDNWLGFLNQWMLRSEYDESLNNLEQPSYLNPWLRDESGEFSQYDGHLNDALSEAAIDHINSKGDNSDPWYLQVSFYAPHEPVQAAERFAELYPATEEGAYRALVHQLDENIGKILSALDDSGISENTIVVIVSDNGGTESRFSSNSPFFGIKATYTEGGVRTPLMIRWPDRRYSDIDYPYAVSIMDIYPTLLSAAGIAYEQADLDGRNLLPFIEQDRVIERPLYWEELANDSYRYSVLDSSHRWRYAIGVFGDPILLDLESDPSGASNVLTDNPEVGERLHEDYLRWRDEAHQLNTSFEQSETNGAGIVRGDSLQRSPGFGGYTFAVGITPEAGTGNQTIAYQEELLDINYSEETLNVSVQDISLSATLPADGRCHAIIVTAQYEAMISWLLSNDEMESPVELFVDGALVDSTIDRRELPKLADLTTPTYIGYRPGTDSDSRFLGNLTQPILYNHKVWLSSESDKPSAASLSERVCPR